MSQIDNSKFSKEKEPRTVFCEGSRFVRGSEYDVGVVLSTTGKILKKARLPSVSFVLKEGNATAAPSVTSASMLLNCSLLVVKFSSANIAVVGKKNGSDLCAHIFTEESLKVIDGGSGDAKCAIDTNREAIHMAKMSSRESSRKSNLIFLL